MNSDADPIWFEWSMFRVIRCRWLSLISICLGLISFSSSFFGVVHFNFSVRPLHSRLLFQIDFEICFCARTWVAAEVFVYGRDLMTQRQTNFDLVSEIGLPGTIKAKNDTNSLISNRFPINALMFIRLEILNGCVGLFCYCLIVASTIFTWIVSQTAEFVHIAHYFIANGRKKTKIKRSLWVSGSFIIAKRPKNNNCNNSSHSRIMHIIKMELEWQISKLQLATVCSAQMRL